MVAQTPGQLLDVADNMTEKLTILKRTCNSPQTPLLVALCLALWVSVADCLRVHACSPAVLTVPFVLFQVGLVHWNDGPWLQQNGKHVHKCGGILYVVLSEHILGMRQVDMHAVSGLVFQHMPTFLILLCSSSLREAFVTFGFYALLVYPLSDTWGQFNAFLLHSLLICFSAWLKEKLLTIIKQSEDLLNVRGMILDASIARKKEELEELEAKVKNKEQMNSQLLEELEQQQQAYQKLREVAEQAFSLAGEVHQRKGSTRAMNAP